MLYNQRKFEATPKIHKRDDYPPIVGRLWLVDAPCLLARWIVRSVPLEIAGSSGHEMVPTRGNPGLERPGRPRGERIEGLRGKHLWTPQ
ncbi:hypothetical protein TNCV_2329301 [Trichonephila clavipes]|nr:hypothetical protein TNCV_2329301 [Trichonephila clavipes]